MGQPYGHPRVVRERVGEPPVPRRRRDHALEADEGRVGFGRQRERRHHDGEHVPEHLAELGRRLDEPRQDLAGRRRLVEPERP